MGDLQVRRGRTRILQYRSADVSMGWERSYARVACIVRNLGYDGGSSLKRTKTSSVKSCNRPSIFPWIPIRKRPKKFAPTTSERTRSSHIQNTLVQNRVYASGPRYVLFLANRRHIQYLDFFAAAASGGIYDWEAVLEKDIRESTVRECLSSWVLSTAMICRVGCDLYCMR